MAVKEVTRAYTAYDYVWKGKCPGCGKEQSNEKQEYVDVLCTECLLKNIENKIDGSDDKYVGSIVIDHKNPCQYGSRHALTLLNSDLSAWNISMKSPIIFKLSEGNLVDKLGYNNKEEELQNYFGYRAAKERNDVPLYKKFLANVMSKFKGE